MDFKTPYADKLPPLSTEEYDALKMDIEKNGVRLAIVVDEEGNILDGHHRYKIDPNAPYTVLEGLSPEEKEAYVLANNMKRRNLSVEQKAELSKKMIAVEIALNVAGKTQEQIAVLLGVSQRTISEWLIITNSKDAKSNKHDCRVKIPPEANPIILERYESGDTQSQIAADYGVTQPAIIKHIETAKKARTKQNKREELARIGAETPIQDKWNIELASVENWIAPRQYDFIITDPPYPKEYLLLYEVLAKRSMEWLKPGGLLITMCGQSYIDQVYEFLNIHLEYYWTACYLTPGQTPNMRQKQVNPQWKPLLIFSRRGDKYDGKVFSDVFRSDENDKDFHEWGQSISGMLSIISQICLTGQYILDPFCGAGTTGIAALKHGCLFDGIDIDIEKVNISKGRLAKIEL